MPVFGPSAVSSTDRKSLLQNIGPQLSTKVSNPLFAQYGNELSANFIKNEINAKALIDTGASMNCIDNNLAKRAELMIADKKMMSSVSSRIETPVYLAQIYIPALDEVIKGKFYGTDLIISGQENHILLGRPFLENYILTYNGPEGTFALDKEDNIHQNYLDI